MAVRLRAVIAGTSPLSRVAPERRRYADDPEQAMSYLPGKRAVTRLAETWMGARGGTPRAFHDGLLSWGSVPPAAIASGTGPRPAAARVSS